MAQLNTIHNIVKDILTVDKEARTDDFILIYDVLKWYYPDFKLDSLLINHKELGVPSIESITRARRKVQELNPELKDEKAAGIRKEEEKEYKQYALNFK